MIKKMFFIFISCGFLFCEENFNQSKSDSSNKNYFKTFKFNSLKKIKLTQKLFNQMWQGHKGAGAALKGATEKRQCAINFSFGIFKDTRKNKGMKGTGIFDIEDWRKYINKNPINSQGAKRKKATGGGYARTTWTEYSAWDSDSEAVLAAIDLIDWFRTEIFGAPDRIITSRKEQKKLEHDGNSYLLFFLHPVGGYAPTIDHIDLWDGKKKMLRGDRKSKKDSSTWRFQKGAKEIWLWKVKK